MNNSDSRGGLARFTDLLRPLGAFITDFHNRTVAFRMGDWIVTTYTFFVAAAFAVGFTVSLWYDAMTGEDPGRMSKLHLLVTLPCILVGLRVSSILTEWDKLFRNPLHTLFRPGFMLHGGIIGGAIAFWPISRLTNGSYLAHCDGAALALALGESVARLGCHVYGCCWGRPTEHCMGIRYTSKDASVVRNNPRLAGIPLHPVQLYSAAFSLILFTVLLQLLTRKSFDGTLTAAYCLLHSGGRVVLETFRQDNRGQFWGGWSHTNIYSLLMVVAGLWLFAIRHHLPNTPLNTAIGPVEVLRNGVVLLFQIPFCLIIACAYGVHYKEVGRWISLNFSPPGRR